MDYKYILYGLLYATIFLFSASKIFNLKRTKPIWLIYYFSVSLCMIIPSLLITHSFLRFFSMLFLISIIGAFVLKIKFLKSFFISSLSVLVFGIFGESLTVATLMLTKYDMSSVYSSAKNDDIIINLLTYMYALIITFAIYLIVEKKRQNIKFSFKNNIITSTIPLLLIGIYYCIYGILLKSSIISVNGVLGSILIALPIAFLVYNIFILIDKKNSQKRLAQMLELQKTSFDLYENAKEFTHDYKNLMIYFQGCLKNEDYGRMSEMVDEKLEDLQTVYNSSFQLDLNNIESSGIRWLLVSKISDALKNSVSFEVTNFDNIENCGMKKNEFVDTLGILINNAIESAEESDKKKVFLALNTNENGYILSIANTFGNAPEISKIFERNYSTKEGHFGIGLNKVNKIINKHNNLLLNVEVKNEYFILNIIENKKSL